MQKIQSLALLLKPILEEDLEIVSYTTNNLTKPGENYGSLIVSLEVKLKTKCTKTESTLQLVAKLSPQANYIKDVFKIPDIFRNEIGFYHTILPHLKHFLYDSKIFESLLDCFPKYYGSRLSLDPQLLVADDDVCLLLENLHFKKYELIEQQIGFNLGESECILIKLAVFHATCTAFNLKQREKFRREILARLSGEFLKNMLSKELVETAYQLIIENTKKNSKCASHIARVDMALKKCLQESNNNAYREPWLSIVFNDFWVNNILLKYNSAGIPETCAFLDFQITICSNPLNDLIFFLYTSVQNQIRQAYFQRLTDLYYNEFIRCLRLFQIEIDQQFSYKRFLQELSNAARVQFFHICFMFSPIFKDKNQVSELKDMDDQQMAGGAKLTGKYYEKLWGTIEDYVDKNWI